MLGYKMRRQRAELLSLSLSAALYASGRSDIVDDILCTHAICELECLFYGPPPAAVAALSSAAQAGRAGLAEATGV